MAETMAEIELATYQLGCTVVDTLEVIQRIIHLEMKKARLMARPTPRNITSYQRYIALRTAINAVSRARGLPYIGPSGRSVEEVQSIGETYSQSPSFLEPIVGGMWGVPQPQAVPA